MIKKIRIRGFKKFAEQEFEIPRHLVVVGPNNSGKTSLLQAVGAWMEAAFQWGQGNSDFARDGEGDYLASNITVDSFGSVLLADFDHLWSDKKTDDPIVVWLETSRWKIGFEFLHKEKELVAVRPVRDVKKAHLEELLKDGLDDLPRRANRSWRPVYIPPVSGVETAENLIQPDTAILDYLARADAGKVLRNLLWRVRENGNWDALNNVIKSFFGYKMATFSGSGPFLSAPYWHSSEEAIPYDLSSAGSGFQQVLLIYAAIFGQPSALYLIDEPDAHLHISLQNKLFRDLIKRAQRDKFQIIVATHSECLIREAETSHLRLLDAHGHLRQVPSKYRVLASLELDQVEIVEALRERRLLYLEGPSDIQILRSWAGTLEHRCLPFFERTTPVETAQRKNKHFAMSHFYAMRTLIPQVRGMQLFDGDKRVPVDPTSSGRKSRLNTLFWERKEIQSYLLHPDSVIRYLQSRTSRENVAKAQQYMKDNLRPRFFEAPDDELPFLGEFAIKEFFSKLFQEAGLPSPSDKDYFCMAEQMKASEIHPEVLEKLDQVADHLRLAEN